MLVVSTIHLDIIIIDIGVSFEVWIIVSSASFGGLYDMIHIYTIITHSIHINIIHFSYTFLTHS